MHLVGESSTYNQTNSEVALNVLQILDRELKEEEMRQFLLQVKQPCRFEQLKHEGQDVVLDVCHNPQSFKETFRSLHHQFGSDRKIRLVIAQALNKSAEYIIDLLRDFPNVSSASLVSSPHMRLKKVAQIQEEINQF
mmetsp:Transcript_17663/g.29847  ORF Transcript_17663/g.29847 Transcript_17663/m.29847 type:complete len:137 (+) Transcript_17663:1030-1440(+)